MSSVEDAAKDLIAENSRTLAPEAVYSQILLMTLVSVATVAAFNLLRPKNKIIYEPKVKYHVGDSKRPPRITDSICGWLPPLIHTKEPELVDKIGLDAAAFLRFGRLMRWLFTGIAAISCGILVPLNIVYNLRHVDAKARDTLSMMTIRDVSGNVLFVHVGITYLITFFIMFLVYVNWVKMVELRRAWFRSPEYLAAFYARTLTVLHVPKSNQSDAGIKEIFDSLRVPYPTTSVHIGRKVGKLPELIEYHNETVRELETYLVQYLRGGKIGKRRPTIRVGASCGCGGTKKDAIDFYTEKLKRTEAAIEDYRQHFHEHKPENYGFASMAAVPYAHVVAKILGNKHPKGTDISLAPNPKDIIWENMNKSDAELASKRMMGFIWLAVVCFFNTVPLFVISILANLTSLTSYVGFLDQWNQQSHLTFQIVSGVLPPAVSGFFGFFLPVVMRWLSRYMGALTNSRLDRAVVARYFTFLVISQLFIFTLIGVLFQSVEQIVIAIGGKKSFAQIINNLNTLPGTINRTYINQSSYWLTFFPLRGFLVLFDLAQIVNLLWLSFKTRAFGRTPRDIREWTQPPEFQYAVYYSNILFMGTVGLVFAPLAPLVALAAAVVLWMSSIVEKYQLMFVFITKVESGGRLWNVVINRLLFTVVLMQLLMTLTIGLQYGWKSFTWVATLPPILIIAGFKIYIGRVFDSAFRYYIPTADELAAAKIHSERADARANKLEKRFGHPALHADLFTPMLHANMMGLLGQVYQGKIGRDQAKLGEYGGQKMEAQVVQGIKIAAIDHRDLEYDPNLYRRNFADDWDAQSMASTTVFGDSSVSLHPAKSQYYASDVTLPRLQGYDSYLAGGPSSAGHQDIELSRLDSMNEPLLSPRTVYYQNQGAASQGSIASPASLYQEPMMAGGSREAPVHRPQGNYTGSIHDSPGPHYQDLTPGGYGQPQQYPPQPQYQQQQYPPQQYHQQQPSQFSRPGTPNSQQPQQPRSMSPGPQRMMTPNPQQRSMSPGPQRMMTPNPQQQRMSPNPQQQWGPNPQQPRGGTPGPTNDNMAGRGAFRG
ncbi:hypothetical protein B0H17DRAFT_1204191 [Mycena rosella]|uniref:DUF221-domain-containing protein n=1 Tax=Mycena rosella TaxID=1033263 RepID=A0AAD7DA74_MYCRO|nr:hypothetical protein B0H17DRAFT_1204191 [Mycena rosella]